MLQYIDPHHQTFPFMITALGTLFHLKLALTGNIYIHVHQHTSKNWRTTDRYNLMMEESLLSR